MNLYHQMHPSRVRERLGLAFGIIFSLIIIGIGIGLAYVVHVDDQVLNSATWVSVPATITYNYSLQERSGRASVGFNTLKQAVYTFITADSKTYTGHDYETINGTVSSDFYKSPTTEEGTIYYDQNDPNVSYTYLPSSYSDYSFAVGAAASFLILFGTLILFECIKSAFIQRKSSVA